MGLRVTPQFDLEDGPFRAVVDFLLDDSASSSSSTGS